MEEASYSMSSLALMQAVEDGYDYKDGMLISPYNPPRRPMHDTDGYPVLSYYYKVNMYVGSAVNLAHCTPLLTKPGIATSKNQNFERAKNGTAWIVGTVLHTLRSSCRVALGIC
jgi:hypothetical protein